LPDGADFLKRQLDETVDKLKLAERDVVEKQKVSDLRRSCHEVLVQLKNHISVNTVCRFFFCAFYVEGVVGLALKT
jgi:hypothetical protein